MKELTAEHPTRSIRTRIAHLRIIYQLFVDLICFSFQCWWLPLQYRGSRCHGFLKPHFNSELWRSSVFGLRSSAFAARAFSLFPALSVVHGFVETAEREKKKERKPTNKERSEVVSHLKSFDWPIDNEVSVLKGVMRCMIRIKMKNYQTPLALLLLISFCTTIALGNTQTARNILGGPLGSCSTYGTVRWSLIIWHSFNALKLSHLSFIPGTHWIYKKRILWTADIGSRFTSYLHQFEQYDGRKLLLRNWPTELVLIYDVLSWYDSHYSLTYDWIWKPISIIFFFFRFYWFMSHWKLVCLSMGLCSIHSTIRRMQLYSGH